MRPRPLDLELAHVRDVEDAGVAAHGAVLGDHALVLHGHLPAGERDQPRAERDVPLVERRSAQRLHDAPDATAGWFGRVASRAEEGRHFEDVLAGRRSAASLFGRGLGAGASLRRHASCAGARRVRLRPKPVAITVTRHLVLQRVVDHGAEDHVGVLVGRARDDLGRLVHLEQPDVGWAADVQQDPRRALDRRLEERRGDGRARGLGRAVLARRRRRCPSAPSRRRA